MHIFESFAYRYKGMFHPSPLHFPTCAGRDSCSGGRHVALHRGHHPLRLHRQDLQQEKKEEAGER